MTARVKHVHLTIFSAELPARYLLKISPVLRDDQ